MSICNILCSLWYYLIYGISDKNIIIETNMSNTSKWVLIVIVVLAFVGFAVYQHVETTKPAETATTTSGSATTTTSTSGTAAAGGTSSVSTAPAAAPVAAAFKDGTYKGAVENAFYGDFQVAAVISGGKLSDVEVLQYPNDRQNSQDINNNAIPTLKSEAIKAQSGNVDIVSGATQSSQAFAQSLTDALNQAKS